MYISVIVTTYNWPKALFSVLKGLRSQTNKNFEVIIADDGSKEETKILISNEQKDFPVPLIHAWQEDKGFQAAKCRNMAIQKAKGDYIVFLDGDCIPLPTFINNHYLLSKKGFFVAGNRVLLSEKFTNEVLNKKINIHKWKLHQWIIATILGKCNRFSPLLNIPFPRKIHLTKWQGVKGCNFAAWKNDLINVNGWDESFVGWGYEDSDIIIRLIKAKVFRIEGRFKIPVIHLWHKENDRGREKQNWDKLQEIIDNNDIKAKKGLLQ